jgi:hypothetical protein
MSLGRFALFVAAAAMVLTSFSGCFIGAAPAAGAADASASNGISWKPVVPVKSAAIVGYDPNSYADDYAYLAAVPSSTFYSKSSDKIYSYPVLFYQPETELPDEQKVLNPGQGVKYFTEDWMTYADGSLDRVQFINLPSSKAKEAMSALNISASARAFSSVSGNTFATARDIALSNWESSKEAVVAVVKDSYPKATLKTSGTVNGTIPSSYKVESKSLSGDKEVGITPIFHNFSIAEPYKYIQAHMDWSGTIGGLDPITQRGKDPDLVLYDWQLGECSASSNWNVLSGVGEDCGSYVYHWGDWGFTVTYMPTKAMSDDETGLTGLVPVAPPEPEAPARPDLPGKPTTAHYTITYTLMPGMEVPLKDKTCYYARDASFTLSWTGDAKLGIAIIGPEGAEISYDATGVSPQQVNLEELGEGQYKVAIVKLADSSSEANWKLDYSWKQNKTRMEGDLLAGAANGAVLASLCNAPLLYATPDGVPAETLEALDTLGVTKVHLVQLGGHGGDAALKGLSGHRSLFQPKIDVQRYTGYKGLYDRITGTTKTKDAVFTTIDPWSYWNVGGKGPAGEEPKGLFIGPAALLAAHHGTPVLVVDNAGNLSCAKAWHSKFWLYAYPGRAPPSVSCMALTARSVYKHLADIGLDKPGKENITTVADQFDIGTAWDRSFVGGANAGRIMGSPVDTSYWVSRCALYQAVIYANPATGSEGVDMITGTESMVPPGPEATGIRTIPGVPTHVTAPVVQTWVSYQHRFNERASKYWRTNYVTATGIVPYWDPSDNPIDEGVNAAYGQSGQYWPDITTSEVVPFYVEKGGYSSVYATNFDDTMSNLNQGTIMWLEVMHGGNRADGIVGFWRDDSIHNEKNPWRGYEASGCTREPDTFAMSKLVGFDMHRSVSDYDRDGVIIAIINQEETVTKGGHDFDRALENVHSMGFNGGSCLIANTYLHLTMVRHGSVFQVIDPWLTSWYASFAMATFARGIAMDVSIGECYSEGIKHVGIEYLTGQWWWDIYENVIFYGDPKIKVWSPNNAWAEPVPLKTGALVDGHDPFGADKHPAAIGSTLALEIGLVGGVAAAVGAVVFVRWRKLRLRNAVQAPEKQKA